MINKILFCDPPHPIDLQQKELEKKLPNDLLSFQDMDFSMASTSDEIFQCFQKIISYLKHESSKNNIKLIQFIFVSLQPNMFPFFLKSNLPECIPAALNKILSESRNELSSKIDELLYLFLSRLVESIMKSLNEPAMRSLQLFIVKADLRKSANLLRAMYASNRLTEWVDSKNKTGDSLQIILEAIHPAPIPQLPSLLASEIARCLIISTLFLGSLQCFDVENTKSLLVSCISRFLRYKPESFANPSTISCLREITTKKIIAPPLCELKSHSELVEIPNILQLVRFWLFIVGTYNPENLIQIASISSTLQSDVISFHYKIFGNNPRANDFFRKSLVIDGVCNFITFNEIPNNIHDLALFIRNRAHDSDKLPIYTAMLGQIISNVYHQIKSLPLCSCDASLMISCAKVISSLISYGLTVYPKIKTEGFEPLSSHYFETACAVAEAMVYSPLYPHRPNDNYISFLVKSAFDELAGTCATRPKEFLSYILNVTSNPAKCLLFTSGLNSPVVIEHHQSTWRHYIINNLFGILKMGLSLLTVPSNITINIVSSFYLTIVNFSVKMNFPPNLLYGILMAPLTLFNSVAEITLQAEPIRMFGKSEDSEYHENCSVINCFFGFIEKILENKYVKGFFNVNAGLTFWNHIKMTISPPFTAVSAQLAARSFRIITKLSDYSNSISPITSAGQRIFIDTIHYNELLEVIQMINEMTDCEYNTKVEKGVFALSIAELLASWCSPRPIAEAVKKNLNLVNTFKKLRFFACDAGEQFEILVDDILKTVEKYMTEIEESEALTDLIEIESELPKFSPSKKLCDMYFKIIQPSQTL